jgi:hypothetical protein
MTQQEKINNLKLFYPQLSDDLIIDRWFWDLRFDKITELPDGLTFNGGISLYDSPIKELPKRLTVNGNLNLILSKVTKLPSDLVVTQSVFFEETIIQSTNEVRLSKNIGSRNDKTIFYIKRDLIKCGCFGGTLAQFEQRVNEVYPNGKHGNNYRHFIAECKSFLTTISQK